jgi:hypothetical protein
MLRVKDASPHAAEGDPPFIRAGVSYSISAVNADSLNLKHAGFRSLAVPELCQNLICLKCPELLFERKQLPQVVDIRHFRMERMDGLEPANILRNQQVAGSIPAGGSISFGFNSLEIQPEVRRAADCGNRRAENALRDFPPRTSRSRLGRARSIIESAVSCLATDMRGARPNNRRWRWRRRCTGVR